MAMRTMPMLLLFWITSRADSAPCGCASLIGMPLTTTLPGAVLITCSGLMRPVSSAQAITSGFIVEPGSKMSVSARLRSCSPLRSARSPGS